MQHCLGPKVYQPYPCVLSEEFVRFRKTPNAAQNLAIPNPAGVAVHSQISSRLLRVAAVVAVSIAVYRMIQGSATRRGEDPDRHA